MKVLLCGPSPSTKGGIGIWMGMVVNYFKEHSVLDVELVLEQVERSADLTLFLPKYKKLYFAAKDYIKMMFKLRKTIINERPDVLHIISSARIGLIRDWLFVNLAKRYKINAIVHYHCGYIPFILSCNNWQSKLLRKVVKKSKAIIVLDEGSYQALHKEGANNIVKIGNCYNPVIDELYSNEERPKKKLLFVGHIVPDKGIAELLKATYDMPNICLHCYGPYKDGYMNELKEFVKSHPFQGELVFHGLQTPDTIFKEMSSSTLFVLPTWWEGFPFVIVEAMACGCPIISTPIGAIEEMLTYKGGIQGYLVEPQNPKMLKEQIEYCLNHIEEANNKAILARQKAKEEYSLEAMMDKLIHCWTN